MAIYKEKQINWLTISIFIITSDILTIGYTHQNINQLSLYWYAFILFVLLVTNLQFFQMTITVDADQLVICFGIGWVRKKIPLKSIRQVSLAKGKWYEGVGIKYLNGGTLYCIRFTDSVELKFHHKLRFTRIGSKNPKQLKQAIEKACHTHVQ